MCVSCAFAFERNEEIVSSACQRWQQFQVYSNTHRHIKLLSKCFTKRMFPVCFFLFATNWHLLLDKCMCMTYGRRPWSNAIKNKYTINLKRSTPLSCQDDGNFQFLTHWRPFSLVLHVPLTLILIVKIKCELHLPTSGLLISAQLFSFSAPLVDHRSCVFPIQYAHSLTIAACELLIRQLSTMNGKWKIYSFLMRPLDISNIFKCKQTQCENECCECVCFCVNMCYFIEQTEWNWIEIGMVGCFRPEVALKNCFNHHPLFFFIFFLSCLRRLAIENAKPTTN